MASPTLKSDIIISIRQPWVDQIVSQAKTHEFRQYLLPECVKRFWIYETSPASAIKYIAEVSPGKGPGSTIKEGSFHDADVVNGRLAEGKFAYEILQLEALDDPITLSELKERDWLQGAPQKYCYLKESMAHHLVNMKTTRIFGHSPIWPAAGTNSSKAENTLVSRSKPRKATNKLPVTVSNGIRKGRRETDTRKRLDGAIKRWLLKEE